jgi:hypothetical protein
MRKLGLSRRARWVLVATCAGAMAAGLGLRGACGLRRDKAVAEQVASRYYQCLMRRDWEGAMNQCWPEFYRAMGRDRTIQLHGRMNAKLGDLRRYDLVGWQFHKQVGAGAGTYLELRYETVYASYPGQEVIVLFRPPWAEEFKLLSHDVNSPGLMME